MGELVELRFEEGEERDIEKDSPSEHDLQEGERALGSVWCC